LEDSPLFRLLPRLTGLWSAMLGGAVGAQAGKLDTNLAWKAVLGLLSGGLVSLAIYFGIMLAIQALIFFLVGAEFDEEPLQITAHDLLSLGVGGMAGLVGAVMVSFALPARSLSEPRGFFFCWTVAAFVPILLAPLVAWLARRR
jgi:uncharacterized protein YacL